MFGGVEHFVSGLENFFICLLGENLVAYVGPDIDGQLVGPQGQDVGGAAAVVKLGRLLTDIIHQFITQLGWKSRHCSGKCFIICILGFWSVDS